MSTTKESTEIEIAVDRGTGEEQPFFCVSMMKLSILSFATFGLYELFWFYKNWALVRARSGHNISPFWRAFFAPIFCYSFANLVNSAAESVNVPQRIRPGPIALIYAGLEALYILPDPYWLIGLFSFIPLIPVARQIRAAHEAVRPGLDCTVGWGGWSYVTLALGGILGGLVIIFVFMPPTRAIQGSEIPSSYEITLEQAGVLEPGERIVFFYSGGIFSILEDGNLLTNRRVVSYETVDGELFVASSTYLEIREFEVEYSESFLNDTIITISTLSGEEFILIVPAEDGRDKDFVSDLEARLPALRLR